jgi:hypothetical protein
MRNTYYCEKCKFITFNKSDYNRHCLTYKHIQENDIQNNNKSFEYICHCGKSYKHQASLSRHKLTHKEENHFFQNMNEEMPIIDSNQILQIVKENQEFKQMFIELNKIIVNQNSNIINQNSNISTLIDLYKTNSTNITNIHSNSHNKTFNLNVFLNETCKDAMNLMDFVNSIQIQLSDLENVGEVGYVKGISNIIIKNLKQLDITERPIHCTDAKREIIYIKDDNKWEKEDDDNKRLTKAIKYIANKNYKLISKFKDKYPDCIHSDSNKSDQYNKLIIEALGGMGDNEVEKNNKIIKQIAKSAIIHKSSVSL